MEGKINYHLFFMGVFSLALTAIFAFAVFTNILGNQIKSDIKDAAQLMAAYYNGSDDYQILTNTTQFDIVLISYDGQLLFDNRNNTNISSYKEFPEIKDAIVSGTGEDQRKLNGKEPFYYYAIRLNDGSILDVSKQIGSDYQSFARVLPWMIIIGLSILLMSILLSIYLTRHLVGAFHKAVDCLDEAESETPYKELIPVIQDLRNRRRQRDKAELMRQEFTANVSHELKTPLTSISGYAEMIENGMAQPQDVKGFAGKIRNEAGRLITLIGDIIRLSQLDSMNEGKDFSIIDLYEIALQTMETLEFSANQKQVSITIEGQPAYISGNRIMLEELVYNLCENAIRYNKIGGRVVIYIWQEGENSILEVEDTGIGISKEYQDRVFERFFRVDKSHSKETGGTGLGLAIVKHIAILHQANIKLESQPTEGTDITLTFPTIHRDSHYRNN